MLGFLQFLLGGSLFVGVIFFFIFLVTKMMEPYALRESREKKIKELEDTIQHHGTKEQKDRLIELKLAQTSFLYESPGIEQLLRILRSDNFTRYLASRGYSIIKVKDGLTSSVDQEAMRILEQELRGLSLTEELEKERQRQRLAQSS